MVPVMEEGWMGGEFVIIVVPSFFLGCLSLSFASTGSEDGEDIAGVRSKS